MSKSLKTETSVKSIQVTNSVWDSAFYITSATQTTKHKILVGIMIYLLNK